MVKGYVMRRQAHNVIILAALAASVVSFCAISAVYAAVPSGLGKAVQKGDAAEVEELIASGADVDLADKGGVTPLMLSSARGDYYIVTMLIYAGADVGLRDKAGRTALMYAAEKGQVYVGKALIAAGAEVGACDHRGDDAESLAQENRHTSMAEALREAERNTGLETNRMRDELRSLYEEGRFDEAADLGELILSARIRTFGKDSSEAASAAQDLGAVYEAKGDYTQAKVYYQLALGIRERAMGPESPLVAETLESLGELEMRMGNLRKTEALLSRALSINETVFGPDHPVTERSMRNMAALLERTGRNAEARDMLEMVEKDLSTSSVVSLSALNQAALPPVPVEGPADKEDDGRRPEPLSVVLAAVAVSVLIFLAYKTGIVMRFVRWSPVADRRISDWFQARTLFSKACNAEREGKLSSAAALYEETLEFDPDHHRARFQFARLLQKGLKNNLAARKQYVILRRKLHRKHPYYRESVDAMAGIDEEGLL